MRYRRPSLSIFLCLLTLASLLRAQETLVVSGTIVKREEVWDRRSNPLMGRPDILEEIRLGLASLTVNEGKLQDVAELDVSIKGHQALLKFGSLGEGTSGKFFLAGAAQPYELLAVESIVRPPATPRPTIQVMSQATQIPRVEFPDNTSVRELKASVALQKKALRAISRRHGMAQARLVFLTSFSGPMPPEGGYQLWGVTGKIRGNWHVWQPGYKGVRRGSDLTDPHRHKK